MLTKLKERWKVTAWQLTRVLVTFATGGFLCGFVGRWVMDLTGFEKNAVWIILYIIIISLAWPLCVLLVSIPLGMFSFFRRYIKKISHKLLGRARQPNPHSLHRVAIFASGGGSNARAIIEYFKHDPEVKISLVLSNKQGAGVLNLAREQHIDQLLLAPGQWKDPDLVLAELKKRKIDFIILAGFLLKVPATIVHAYPKKIINIHPALLPAYGGKGMYGMNVHQAVIDNQEKESGISIHFVDELYDHGQTIFQARCAVDREDSPETLAKKVLALEHRHYPEVIGMVIKKQKAR